MKLQQKNMVQKHGFVPTVRIATQIPKKELLIMDVAIDLYYAIQIHKIMWKLFLVYYACFKKAFLDRDGSCPSIESPMDRSRNSSIGVQLSTSIRSALDLALINNTQRHLLPEFKPSKQYVEEHLVNFLIFK